MGATSAQGWYLFAFLVGFTLGPAGLAGLGWPAALVGFGLLALALVGFRSIKESAAQSPTGLEREEMAPVPGRRAAKSY